MSFPLEVEDADLTKEGLAYKWDAPKFIQVFLKKLRLLALKVGLRGTDPAGVGSSSAGAAGSSSCAGAKSTAKASPCCRQSCSNESGREACADAASSCGDAWRRNRSTAAEESEERVRSGYDTRMRTAEMHGACAHTYEM